MRYSSKYITDYGILRSLNGQKYKLVDLFCYRQRDEEDKPIEYTAKGDGGNDGKLMENLSRSRTAVFELAFCNPWEWFVTLTLDKQKYDRKDLQKYAKDLAQFIRNYRRLHQADVKYLLIPERHKDGSWHMHGFFMGLPVEHLHAFQLSEHLPYRVRERLEQGKQVYTWEAYARKFGFSNIEAIENPEASSKYITKYVTKEALTTITALNAHIYYVSQGLKRSEVIKRDTLSYLIEAPDYKGDHCAVKWFDTEEEAQVYFEGVTT